MFSPGRTVEIRNCDHRFLRLHIHIRVYAYVFVHVNIYMYTYIAPLAIIAACAACCTPFQSVCVCVCLFSPGNAVLVAHYFRQRPIALLVYNCPPPFLINAPKSPLLIILGSHLITMVGAEAYEQAGGDRKRNMVQIGAGAEDRGQEEEEAMDNKVRGHTYTHTDARVQMQAGDDDDNYFIGLVLER
jgi:hypothetical protein